MWFFYIDTSTEVNIMKRLFVAIKVDPSPALLEVYEHMLNAFQYHKISWSDPEKLHLTLKFLGDTEEEKIDSICNVLTKCAQRFRPFDIGIENVGIFGSSYDPKIIWFGINDNEILSDLALCIINELNNIGFDKDRQNFIPHLTVGRIKKIKSKKLFKQGLSLFKGIKIQSSRVESFALYESILKQTGAEHILLKKFTFK